MSNCSERNASMRDYIGRGVLVFAVVLLAIAKNNNWLDGTTIVAIAFLAILGYICGLRAGAKLTCIRPS